MGKRYYVLLYNIVLHLLRMKEKVKELKEEIGKISLILHLNYEVNYNLGQKIFYAK